MVRLDLRRQFQHRMKKVLIVDDNPKLGGQIWRAELGKIKSPEAKNLIEKIEAKQVSIINNAQVFAQKR